MNYYELGRQINMMFTQDPMQRMMNDRVWAALEEGSRNAEKEDEGWDDYEEE